MADAALDPARSASVSASAGTGKTWLLSARILRLLLAGVVPARILALTFTRKAAAEMGARVQQRLAALALADDAQADELLGEIGLAPTPELRTRARAAYENLVFDPQPLRATTLHAFCQDLLARFPRESGVAAGAELVEAESPLLEAAWRRVQKDLLTQPQSAPAQALRELIGEGLGETALRAVVLGFLRARNDWRAYAAHWGDCRHALSEYRERVRNSLQLAPDADPLAAAEAPALAARLNRFAGQVRDAGGNIGKLCTEEILLVLELTGVERLEAMAGLLFTQKGEPRQFKPSQAAQKKLGNIAHARLLESHAELLLEIGTLVDQRRRLSTLRRSCAGVCLGVTVLDALDTHIAATRQMPFAELEWHALRLLQGEGAGAYVQYKLDARIDHLLLDEFQDTSPTQWQLLRPLLEEMAAGSERTRSAFVVGDLKQSIYGFRRAAPELMLEASDWITQRMQGACEALSASRRSAPAIMDVINALFTRTPAAQRLPDFPLHTTHQTGQWGVVECLRLEPVESELETSASAELRNPLLTRRPEATNNRAYAEGVNIAKRIGGLVAARWDIGGRALDYGDVMILLRQRTHQAALERALTEAGIPFTGAARGTLLQTVEVQDLLALLRWLDQPWRDLALAQVLRSPLFNLSDAGLMEIAARARAAQSSWWQVLEPHSALSLLNEWRELSRQLPVHDLLDRIVTQTNLCARYEALLPTAAAARTRANLSRFLQLALETDAGRYPSIARFLAALELLAQDDSPDQAPPPAHSGQVRILTVHAAKGLESAAVFIAQAALAPSPRQAGWRVEWPAGAPQPSDFLLIANQDQRDAVSARLLERAAQREAREDMNLLYVAATRARHFLCVSGFAPTTAVAESWHELLRLALVSLGAAETPDGALRHACGHPQLAPPQPAMDAASDDARLREPIPGFSAALVHEDTEPLDARAAARGAALHAVLQHLAQANPPGEQQLRARVNAQLPAPLSTQEFSGLLAAARALMQAPALARFFDPAQFRQAWNELPVTHAGELQVLDRLVDDGECLWILDYKNGDLPVAQALQRYASQLTRYRAAIGAAWPGRVVRAGLILIARAEWVELVE